MKVKLTAFTHLILELNAMLDTGRHDSITIADVKHYIRDGSILRYIRERGGEDIDLSLLLDADTYGNFETFYVSYLQSICDAYSGNESRKWGVENRGLCLMIAWTNEIVQQGSGWQPSLNVAAIPPE